MLLSWTSLKCLLSNIQRLWSHNIVSVALPLHLQLKSFVTPERIPCPFLTLSQTSPDFYVSAVQVLQKHPGNGRNCS